MRNNKNHTPVLIREKYTKGMTDPRAIMEEYIKDYYPDDIQFAL